MGSHDDRGVTFTSRQYRFDLARVRDLLAIDLEEVQRFDLATVPVLATGGGLRRAPPEAARALDAPSSDRGSTVSLTSAPHVSRAQPDRLPKR